MSDHKQRVTKAIPGAHARKLQGSRGWSIYTASGYRLGGGKTEDAAWQEVAETKLP